jgi:Putative zincin peptidase
MPRDGNPRPNARGGRIEAIGWPRASRPWDSEGAGGLVELSRRAGNLVTAVKSLPAGYGPPSVLNLARVWTIVLLTLGSAVLFVPFAWLSAGFVGVLRRDASVGFVVSSGGDIATLLLVAIGVVVVPVILHEAIHGAFFWLYTRDQPRFGFKGYAASASAPDWHLPRGQYIVVGLAPMILLTTIGLCLLAIAPEPWLAPVVLAIALHGAGTIGDVVSFLWLIRRPANTYFRDSGDVLRAYSPLAPSDVA